MTLATTIDAISGLPKKLEDAHVFHAGTTVQNGQVVTNGGRVLCVTALGDMVKMAQKRAYEIADTIRALTVAKCGAISAGAHSGGNNPSRKELE